jgi:2-methylcitrate dehydratase PrpD
MYTQAKEMLTLNLCRKVSEWHYEDLPEPVVDTVKLLLLDTLGVIGGAVGAPGIRELNARLNRWEKSGTATGLVGLRRYSPPTAALANGAAAHALDFDDQHDSGRVHSSCTVFPAVLAAAEDLGGISGKQFLLALTTGIEINARLGMTCHESLGLGWHSTTLLGSLSATMAVGRLLDLKDERLNHAIGIAYQQSSGSRQSTIEGALTKRLGPGFAARSAVLAAFLAADGVTATRQSLEGKAGLFALYQRDRIDIDALTKDLGKSWRVPDYSFKPYPCCRANHTVIGLGLQCFHEGIEPDLIDSIEIGLGEYNWGATGTRFDPARNDVVHAQFNAAYCFASALTHGRVDLRTFQKPAISDALVADLAGRTATVIDSRIPPKAVGPAYVRLCMRSGDTREIYSDAIKGSTRNPMTKDELLEKARACMHTGLGASAHSVDKLARGIFHLEASTNAAETLVGAFPTSGHAKPMPASDGSTSESAAGNPADVTIF